MVNQMLLEHITPSLDGIKKSLFERLGVNSKPGLKQSCWIDLFCFLIDLLICVNLQNNNDAYFSQNPTLIFFISVNKYYENGNRKYVKETTTLLG